MLGRFSRLLVPISQSSIAISRITCLSPASKTSVYRFAPTIQPLTKNIQINTFSSTSRALAAMTDVSKYKLMHTMLRVKDPKASIKFYEHLGMTLVNKIENPDSKFDLYFLGYEAKTKGKHWTDCEGLIELTHNYGTENDPDFKYHNGNDEPKGFGHLAVSVDNIQAACKRIEDAGYTFKKKLSDGRMVYQPRSIAFVYDPDNYWVEIISQNPVEKTEDIKETDTSKYCSNHVMLRIKDPEKSLPFYQDVMGMKLLRTAENKDAGFNLYFLGYGPDAPESSPNGVNPVADRQGLLELTWNYGTEKEQGQVYHNGNDEPKGFGHVCLSVDDIEAACERFEEKGVQWKKRLTEGTMKNISFVLDPDNYWIEIVQNEKLKNRANW